MRRKSERTVKNSPTKKAETTNRRTTRRNRKSPEKSVNDDDSENSSDQASGSDSEPEEVIAPKRTRRTSRTIEKSSSAEEVKATPTTTTRPKRRVTTKKEADIQEEESTETEQTTLDEPKDGQADHDKDDVDKAETAETSVDSSSTKPTESSNVEPDNSSSIVVEQADVEMSSASVAPSQSENEAENAKEQTQNAVKETVKTDEKIVPEKSRRRPLKRVEREVADSVKPETTENVADSVNETNNENEVENRDKSPKKSSIEEIQSSDDTKSMAIGTPTESSDLQNGGGTDAVDTTAKDTTASENDTSARLSKKKPIVRKRKWLSNKAAAPKVQEITISTDSLKGLISDVKPVPLSDIQLDSSPEQDQEPDDVKVVSSTSIDYNRRSEENLCESTDDGNAVSITTTRKISIVNDSEGEQPPSPAKHTPCNILYITNLVRPFTVLQLKSLLQRTGKIAEDGFWIDKIKSKCFVKYETEE